MKNYWLELSSEVVENEILMVRNSPNTKNWFSQMPKKIAAINPLKIPKQPNDFSPVVGFAHYIRLTRLGVEGVLNAPRKFHRYKYYILFDEINKPKEPFWLVLEKA